MLPENQNCLHKMTIDARDCLADNQIKPANFWRMFLKNQSIFFPATHIFQHCCLIFLLFRQDNNFRRLVRLQVFCCQSGDIFNRNCCKIFLDGKGPLQLPWMTA